MMSLASRALLGFKRSVILTGSGSVRLSESGMDYYEAKADCSWNVPNRSIRDSNLHYKILPDLAHHWLAENKFIYASFVTQYSTFKSTLDFAVRELHAEKGIASEFFDGLRRFHSLRSAMAAAFKEASDRRFIEIRGEIRGETLEAIWKLVPHLRETYRICTITTNWDNSWKSWSESQTRRNDCMHFQIHGSCNSMTGFFLPNDTVFEDFYRRYLLETAGIHPGSSPKARSQAVELTEFVREYKEMDAMSKQKGRMISELQTADFLLIWGLAFNSEDLELRSIVSSVADDYERDRKWPATVLVDINKDVRDHVANLLRLPPAYRFDLDPKRPDYLSIFSMRNI